MDDLGIGGEGGQIAGHAVVKACADRNQQIAFLDGVVGEGAAVHAEHVEALGVMLVESAQAQQRGGDRDVAAVGDLFQDIRRAGDDCPAADVQDRLVGAIDQLGSGLGLVNVFGMG